MEEPQYRLRDKHPVMQQRSRLLGFQRVPIVPDPTTSLPHLNLPMDHLLVETEVPLAGEQAVLQVNPLDWGVLRAGPDADFVFLGEQWRSV